ncbi:Spy/CpxP family protein refolding chaperone (plasmid) [Burkholderia sp. FERM BP-3421]|uniref:Spy/CpxP family protein refolding chaperone n=1 Tax=Burkholderia sp. FERM BP-3421 TaxID=1494466 RepID=UPI00236214B1|nr:Spy/CpxP family protein refolding chaperone [Burkholderia sp. FERM BP-3421]WDD90391.1 Spy/CpxP family protein refolding chaperone [Burkholderia sp. FERM BP-3421]
MTRALLAFPRRIAYANLAAAVALGVAALGTAAFPQCSNAAGPGQDQTPPHVVTVAAHKSVDGRITSMHQRLGITPGQESLWQSVAQVMRDNANAMESLRKIRSDHASSMSAMDDLHSYSDVADTHADGVKKLTTVFQPLYDSMSDMQKQNADAIFRGNDRHLIKKQ